MNQVQMVYAKLSVHPATTKDLAATINIPEPSVRRCICELRDMNLVTKDIGKNWRIIKP